MRDPGLYPPGWVNRLTAWVERLPVPAWVFYVVVWLVLYLIELAIQWTSGAAGTFYPFHPFIAGAIPLTIGFMHYLDRTADTALGKFHSVLNCSDAEYAELRDRLTTLPARPTLLATLVGVVVAVAGLIVLPLDLKLNILHYTDSTASVYFMSAATSIVWCLSVVLAYHTLHQLALVRQIYGRARVNLFNLRPLYAFSVLSARTAIGLQLFTSAFYILVPELLSNVFTVVMGLILSVVAVLTFVWPLLGTHNLLVDEKNHLLGEKSKALEAAITELNRNISSKEVQGIDAWHKAMASLEFEHTAITRISTWPWHPETLRSLVAALLLPVIVWITQWFLQRVLTQ